jgi:hypothetical protein
MIASVEFSVECVDFNVEKITVSDPMCSRNVSESFTARSCSIMPFFFALFSKDIFCIFFLVVGY